VTVTGGPWAMEAMRKHDSVLVGSVSACHSCQVFAWSASASALSAVPSVGRP